MPNETRDPNFPAPPFSEVSRLILRSRPTIEKIWLQRWRLETKTKEKADLPLLQGRLGEFLSSVAQALTPGYPRSPLTNPAAEKVELRNNQTSQTIREYQILGEVIFEILSQQTKLTPLQRLIIQRHLDEAIRRLIV